MKFIRVITADQKVYHGSPYKFRNFDLELIGSNDGNKYGWGIYFTSNLSFASSYGVGKEFYDGEELDVYKSLSIPDLMKGRKQQIINEFKNVKPDVAEFAKNFDPSKYEKIKGYVYICSIPDTKYFLDWYEKIEGQAVSSKILKLAREQKIDVSDNPYGSQFYVRLEDKVGSSKNASMTLLKYDIPGIVYEENGYNFVIWDTSKIKILEIK